MLLSYACPKDDSLQTNTVWLRNAIHFARCCGANRYYLKTEMDSPLVNVRKRLWWSCVIRDRIMALGMRRPIQITSELFDPTRDPWTIFDTRSEFQKSVVYSETTKRQLARLFVIHVRFALAVTSAVMLVYHPNGTLVPGISSKQDLSRISRQVHACQSQLEEWYINSRAEFIDDNFPAPLHGSVVMYRGLGLMHYQ